MWGENLQENPSVRRKNNGLIQKKNANQSSDGGVHPKS